MDQANIALFIFVGFAIGVIATSLFFILRKTTGKVKDGKVKNKSGSGPVSADDDGAFLPTPIMGGSFLELSMDSIVTPVEQITFWKDDALVDELDTSSALVQKYLETDMTTQGSNSSIVKSDSQTSAEVLNKVEPKSTTSEDHQSKAKLSIDTADQKRKKENTGQKQRKISKENDSVKFKSPTYKSRSASHDALIIKTTQQSQSSKLKSIQSEISERKHSKTLNSSKLTEKKNIISQKGESDDDDMPLGLKQFTV